jgi:adenosylcobyric acid synthase
VSKRVPALMIQGTGSHVGKSLMVAGLCRLFANRGMRVAPFKPQNMSNNAAVTADGGEIGRAQALQSRAARIPPSVHMNPVLLKPEGETGAQVVVQGKRVATMRAAEYARRKGELMSRVLESFACVSADVDLMLVEGAGSPAEVNLRAGDIANMGFAEAADLPVVLVADIERGGVIASLVGTHALLTEAEQQRVRGFIVNKFRGDPMLFSAGRDEIVDRTGWPCFGVVPWFEGARDLPAEDSVDLAERATRGGKIVIAVPMLPRIANFDDLDPLRMEPDVSVRLVKPGEAFPVADLVLLPGSKSTISDLAFLRVQGWDVDIAAHVRRGGRVLGLCGGYQMLGKRLSDPGATEGAPGSVEGLGLLDVETVLTLEKTTVRVQGRHIASGEAVAGYEIHLGRTDGADCARPLLYIARRTDGATSADGFVTGSYVHGIFAGDGFRRWFLSGLGAKVSGESYEARVDAALDSLAAHLERHLDCDALLAIARSRAAMTATEPASRR